MSLLLDVAAALDEADVAYVVAGGMAVVPHGHVRTTVDLDIALDLMSVGGVPVRVVSLAHLIEMKRLADREQDRADVAALLLLHPGPTLDGS